MVCSLFKIHVNIVTETHCSFLVPITMKSIAVTRLSSYLIILLHQKPVALIFAAGFITLSEIINLCQWRLDLGALLLFEVWAGMSGVAVLNCLINPLIVGLYFNFLKFYDCPQFFNGTVNF